MTDTSRDKPQIESKRWVSFRLGKENYAVDVMKVREVLTPMDIAPVCGAPSFVLGIVNLRGNVVTVVDGHRKFNIPPQENKPENRIMVLDSGDTVIGLKVDAVREVIDVPQPMIQPPPQKGQGNSNVFISGVVYMNDRIFILIDVDLMLHDVKKHDGESVVSAQGDDDDLF